MGKGVQSIPINLQEPCSKQQDHRAWAVTALAMIKKGTLGPQGVSPSSHGIFSCFCTTGFHDYNKCRAPGVHLQQPGDNHPPFPRLQCGGSLGGKTMIGWEG